MNGMSEFRSLCSDQYTVPSIFWAMGVLKFCGPYSNKEEQNFEPSLAC